MRLASFAHSAAATPASQDEDNLSDVQEEFNRISSYGRIIAATTSNDTSYVLMGYNLEQLEPISGIGINFLQYNTLIQRVVVRIRSAVSPWVSDPAVHIVI